MKILYKNEADELAIINIMYACYDDNLFDVPEEVDDEEFEKLVKAGERVIFAPTDEDDEKVEGLYLLSVDYDEIRVKNMNKPLAEEIIRTLYDTNKADLTGYDVVMEYRTEGRRDGREGRPIF